MSGNAATVVIFDDGVARTFEPFARSRPIAEVRAGALLVRERWEHVIGSRLDAFAARVELADFAEFEAPPFVCSEVPAGSIILNSRALPDLAMSELRDSFHDDEITQWIVEGRVAARRVREAVTAEALVSGRWNFDMRAVDDGITQSLNGWWLDASWDVIRHLAPMLSNDIPALASKRRCERLPTESPLISVSGAHPVWLEEGASVENFTVFDTTSGPVFLSRGSVVHSFTRVVGPCFVGEDSTVTADRISGCSIGNVCRVHGEISSSVLIGHSNKGHDGFIGNSILGRWVNLGAGTITSNLKNTYGTVAFSTPTGLRDTGMQFLGTMFGDHVKTGIGLRLTTGCLIGAGSSVTGSMPPKTVSPFSWGSEFPYSVFELNKFLETAERMMSRRHVESDDLHRRLWTALHNEQCEPDAASPHAASPHAPRNSSR